MENRPAFENRLYFLKARAYERQYRIFAESHVERDDTSYTYMIDLVHKVTGTHVVFRWKTDLELPTEEEITEKLI